LFRFVLTILSLRDEFKEETERVLWQTAAQEYRDILLAWPNLAPAWRRDGQDVLLQLKAAKKLPPGISHRLDCVSRVAFLTHDTQHTRHDINDTTRHDTLGVVLATIMKTEALWYLHEKDLEAGRSSPSYKKTLDDEEEGDEKTRKARKKKTEQLEKKEKKKKKEKKEKSGSRIKRGRTKKKKNGGEDEADKDQQKQQQHQQIDFAWRDLEGMARQAVFALVKNLDRDELVSQSALGEDRANRRHNTMLAFPHIADHLASGQLLPSRKPGLLFDIADLASSTVSLSTFSRLSTASLATSSASAFVDRMAPPAAGGFMERFMGREVFFVSPHGRYLCVVRRDGGDPLETGSGREDAELMLSTTDRMCCNAIFLLVRVRAGADDGSDNHAGQAGGVGAGASESAEELICIRFGLNGHYVCMDAQGKPALKHHMLHYNLNLHIQKSIYKHPNKWQAEGSLDYYLHYLRWASSLPTEDHYHLKFFNKVHVNHTALG
jgi:hypothetical protein